MTKLEAFRQRVLLALIDVNIHQHTDNPKFVYVDSDGVISLSEEPLSRPLRDAEIWGRVGLPSAIYPTKSVGKGYIKVSVPDDIDWRECGFTL